MTRFLTCLALLLVACEGNNEGSNPVGPDAADPDGNLVIRNMTGSRIVLYSGETRLKVVPDDLGDYVVDVPNPNSVQVDLRIHRFVDVEDDPDTPDPSTVLKRWVVALAADNEPEHRSTWIVSNEESDTGTLILEYVGGTETSVDVYLDSRTGAKLASLRPGGSAQQVGVDYGVYTVHYRYWKSDPNSANAEELVGWRDTEVVNDSEEPIFVLLNDSRSTRVLQIPHFDAGQSLWGTITVVNSTSRPVRLWSGSQLIEEIVYVGDDESRTNLSSIAANESMDFILPVGDYRLIAKDPQTNAEVVSVDLSITADLEVTWDLASNEVTSNIVISGTLPE